MDPKWLSNPHDPMRMMSFDVMTQEVGGAHTHTRTLISAYAPSHLRLRLQLEEAEAQRSAATRSRQVTDATVVGGRVMILQRRIEVC